MRAKRIGIAGEIGAGKSTIARLFGEAGCLVHDADAVARRALESDEVRALIRERWGDNVFASSGTRETADRVSIAAIVFQDDAERQWLEGVVHPRVRAEQDALLAEADAAADGATRDEETMPAVILDVPLLFEAGLDRLCDLVVFVTAPRAVRLERVERTRGWDDAELARREAVQTDASVKQARSDAVIENVGTLEDARQAVRAVLQDLQAPDA